MGESGKVREREGRMATDKSKGERAGILNENGDKKIITGVYV